MDRCPYAGDTIACWRTDIGMCVLYNKQFAGDPTVLYTLPEQKISYPETRKTDLCLPMLNFPSVFSALICHLCARGCFRIGLVRAQLSLRHFPFSCYCALSLKRKQ